MILAVAQTIIEKSEKPSKTQPEENCLEVKNKSPETTNKNGSSV